MFFGSPADLFSRIRLCYCSARFPAQVFFVLSLFCLLPMLLLMMLLLVVIIGIVGLCAADDFYCLNGECVLSNLTCDGKANCLDGTDELRCTGLSAGNGPPCFRSGYLMEVFSSFSLYYFV